MIKKIILIVIVVGLAFILFSKGESKEYSSSALGLSFKYPSVYTLEERSLSPSVHNISLLKPQDIEGSEGPTAISITLYKGHAKTSPQDWVKTNKDSNYGLKLGEIEEREVLGKKAVFYVADGLYVSDNYVFFYADTVVHASVSYLTKEDRIRKDFNQVLMSLRFAKGGIKGFAKVLEEPYKTDLELVDFVTKEVVQSFSTKSDGSFEIEVEPGEYTIRSASQRETGRTECGKNGVVPVEVGGLSEVIVFCDTGIR